MCPVLVTQRGWVQLLRYRGAQRTGTYTYHDRFFSSLSRLLDRTADGMARRGERVDLDPFCAIPRGPDICAPCRVHAVCAHRVCSRRLSLASRLRGACPVRAWGGTLLTCHNTNRLPYLVAWRSSWRMFVPCACYICRIFRTNADFNWTYMQTLRSPGQSVMIPGHYHTYDDML